MNEPTHDPQIQQWFQSLGPSPAPPASPHLQAKVRARILDQQTRAGLWPTLLTQPVWRLALTAAFVLSLSANIWWGLGSRKQEAPKVASPFRSLSVYAFQAQLPHSAALQTAVTARATIEPEKIGRSFVTQQDRRVAFFRLGTAYADALAALHSRDVDVASTYLSHLNDILHQVQAPPILSSYLREVSAWIHSSDYTDDERTQFLALFEPLYITAYKPSEEPYAVSLFQVSAWLENMALAAVTHNPVAPQQASILQAYRDTLVRLQAPSQTIEAFDRIRSLATQTTLTPAERQHIRRLVQTLQRVLGAIRG